MKKLHTIPILLFLLLSVGQGWASDNGSTRTKKNWHNMGCTAPKVKGVAALYITPLEFKHLSSKAVLFINHAGVSIDLCAPLKMRDLDKATAIQVFGELGYGEDPEIKTFDVLANCVDGPNIFHIEVEFDENDRLQRYRVRGYGIENPEWRQVIAEKKQADN